MLISTRAAKGEEIRCRNSKPFQFSGRKIGEDVCVQTVVERQMCDKRKLIGRYYWGCGDVTGEDMELLGNSHWSCVCECSSLFYVFSLFYVCECSSLFYEWLKDLLSDQ